MLPSPVEVWNGYVFSPARTMPMMHVKHMVQWYQTNKSDLTHKVVSVVRVLLYIGFDEW
jgi:hypothetical protein